ncbi:hypothetical protein RM780_00425 [Streptomyces sp. DSM 44917]|uniref:Uncharacterized protein n=1 Tax=Streptomyces boetiae TaxID=3075541 RepID=A0ABU2L1J3_9ACTN|nr:hypothetical protein [Streptomyces sp. DSM 44917]MDT0305431.1 hypothetical protein [Streptomyces sp. DSM 44917]
MSLELREILDRSNEDLPFRTAVLDGDLSVLDGYDLTPEELRAVREGDEDAIYVLLGDTRYFHIREQGTYGDDGSH